MEKKNTQKNRKYKVYRDSYIKNNYVAFTFRLNKEKDAAMIELLQNQGMKGFRNALNNYLIDCEYMKEEQ